MKLRALFILVGALHLIPVWRVDLIPTVDGPSHLYNAVVLHELADGAPEFSRVFQADLRPHPNWLGHAVLFLLLYAVPPIAAEKLLFSLIVVLFLAGAWMLAGIADERNRVYAFLVMPLTFHLLLQMGFYNYALGAAILPFALVSAWRGKRVATTVLLVVLYFAHAVPAALAMLLVAMIVAARRAWREGVALVPSALLFTWFALQPKLPGGEWTWDGALIVQPLLRVGLLLTFDLRQLTFGTVLGIVYGVLIAVTLVRERRDWTFLVMTLVVVALYLAAPLGVQEGFVLKARLLLFPYLLILPWLTPRVPVVPLAIVLALVATANVVFIRNQWKRNADVMQRAIAVVESAAPRKTIVPLIFDRSSPHSTLPLLGHAVSYAAIDRRLVDYGNYEAGLGFFPVGFRAPGPAISDLETRAADFDPEQFSVVVDYIYLLRMKAGSPLEGRLLRSYELVREDGDARLYGRRR